MGHSYLCPSPFLLLWVPAPSYLSAVYEGWWMGLRPSSLLHSSAKLGLILEWGWDGKTNNEHITELLKNML